MPRYCYCHLLPGVPEVTSLKDSGNPTFRYCQKNNFTVWQYLPCSSVEPVKILYILTKGEVKKQVNLSRAKKSKLQSGIW